MDNYINNYANLKKKIVYNFQLNSGGIGDCIKFFMHLLNLCIKYDIKLYYQLNNILIEKYLKLKYIQMYIKKEDINNKININDEEMIKNINNDDYNIVVPFIFYTTFNYDNLQLNIQEVFEFSEEIKINSNKLHSNNIINYISIHLRLGDKYLETEYKNGLLCPGDERFM